MPGLLAALAALLYTEAGPGLSPWLLATLAHDSSSHTWPGAAMASVQWAARGHGWQGGG